MARLSGFLIDIGSIWKCWSGAHSGLLCQMHLRSRWPMLLVVSRDFTLHHAPSNPRWAWVGRLRAAPVSVPSLGRPQRRAWCSSMTALNKFGGARKTRHATKRNQNNSAAGEKQVENEHYINRCNASSKFLKQELTRSNKSCFKPN